MASLLPRRPSRRRWKGAVRMLIVANFTTVIRQWSELLKKCVNPLTTNAKRCSDWAEIFSVASFIYLKNIINHALISYLTLLKSY
jgi:hypothetical protein